jgi:hypothetical protein
VATLVVSGEELVLHLPIRQKLASFHGDLRVPLTAVRSVSVMDKTWMELRGRRMAGIAFPGSIAMGTRIHEGGFDFCILRRTEPAVRVDLATGRFSRWVVGVPSLDEARAEVERVAAAAGIAPHTG